MRLQRDGVAIANQRNLFCGLVRFFRFFFTNFARRNNNETLLQG